MSNLNRLRLARYVLKELAAYLPNAELEATGASGASASAKGTFDYHRPVSNDAASIAVWTGLIDNWAPAGGTAFAVDNLYATPITIGRNVTLRKFRINVTAGGAAGSVWRFGMYSNQDNDAYNYPNACLVDSGDIATTGTGYVAATLASPITLTPGLYWIVWSVGTSAPSVSYYTPNCAKPLYTAAAATATCLFTKARAHAALPATFPTDATGSAGNFPALFLELVPA